MLNLRGLASVAAEQGRAERAARLFGAEHLVRESIGLVFPPGKRVAHERTVAATHAAVGGEAFTAAWAKGEAMTTEQAVEYALSAADSLRHVNSRSPADVCPSDLAGILRTLGSRFLFDITC
jgi:hypothetical protein